MPKACCHCVGSYRRAKKDVSVSAEPVMIHSGLYAWRVASWVKKIGPNGSQTQMIELTFACTNFWMSGRASS